MAKLIIDDSKLIKLNIDYEQIEDYEGNILLNGKLQINSSIKEKKQRVIKVYIDFRKENEEDILFSFVYRFLVHLDGETSEKNEDELLQNFASTDAYSKAQEFLQNFYKVSNIEFIDLPSMD